MPRNCPATTFSIPGGRSLGSLRIRGQALGQVPRGLLIITRCSPPAACAPGSSGSRPALLAVWMSFVHRCQPSHHHPLNLRTRDHHLPPTPHHSCPSPPTVSDPSFGHLTLSSTCLGLGMGNQSPCPLGAQSGVDMGGHGRRHRWLLSCVVSAELREDLWEQRT